MATDAHPDSSDGPFDDPVRVDGEQHLTDLVGEHDVVLVDFRADWCGPCTMLEPVLEDLAGETEAVIATVDVDAHQRLAADFGVRGVPTLALFANGEQVEQHAGALPADRLRDVLDGYAD